MPRGRRTWSDASSGHQPVQPVHLGIATASDDGGLIVLVVRDAQTRSLLGLAGIAECDTVAKRPAVIGDQVVYRTTVAVHHGRPPLTNGPINAAAASLYPPSAGTARPPPLGARHGDG